MAPVLSKQAIKYTAAAGAIALCIGLCKKNFSSNNKKSSENETIHYTITDKDANKKIQQKVHVNKEFFKQLNFLLKILVPKLWSSESALLILVAATLVGRTACDIWMIQNATIIESAIITMDTNLFKTNLLQYTMALPLISIITNLLKWSLGELKIKFRTNLTKHFYQHYLKGFTYYKMTNLDNRMSNVDQILTTDISKFCESVVDLYSNISKPMLDIILYVYRLTINLGGKTPSLLIAYLLFAGTILTKLRKPIGKLTVQEQKLEGEFRYINSRLITNSEEVAFYNGNNREKLTLYESYHKLQRHLRKFLNFRVNIGIIDNILGKYIATVVGFYAVSLPFFSKDHPLASLENKGERLKTYYTYGRMLVKLAEAIGRLVLSGRELSRLAGFTARMIELRDILNDLNNGVYKRIMVNNKKEINETNAIALNPKEGKIILQDHIIKFDKVPLMTPNGEILVKELSFEVRSGMNVLVCGPNGCGKSSLFRTLGELWPSWGGCVIKPAKGNLFYIPQKPYMTLGTLRDQIIYPHTEEEMKRRGITDSDLLKYLDIVQLSYLIDSRINGLNSVEDWIDILSGGEKQRIAMSRLFYHNPQFAILDECTSAVSVDVEDSLYRYCKESGITLFTVSHRKSLWKHHEYCLQFDGKGNYRFDNIENVEEFGS